MSRGRPTITSALRSEIPRGSSVLLAVSGGADSVSLAHGVASLSKSLKLRVAIAHVDHALRAESSKDAAWVSDFGKALGLETLVRRLKSAPATNIEAWARRERYRALETLRSKYEFDWVVTAHSANDVAETLLMRLVANKELGSIDRIDPRRKLLRPFLSVTRSDVLRYIERNSLLFLEDPSNLSLRYLRNRVRLRIMPHLIEEFGDGVVQSLAWEAKRVASDLNLLRRLSRAHSKAFLGIPFGTREWLTKLRATLKDVPRPVKLRLINVLFSPQVMFSLGVRHSERVLHFIESDRASVQLPSGIVLRRRAGGIEIHPACA